MIDFQSCTVVELVTDEAGKVWLNVDGKCEVRIGFANNVVVEFPSAVQRSGSQHFTFKNLKKTNQE